LPGYQSSGFLGVWLFIALRFLDGIALGGEYTAANPLAMEYSPKQARGFNGALITGGYAVASIAISVVTFLTLRFAPAGGVDAPYVQWGWRVPFVIGALLSFTLFLYVRRSVPESQLWIDAEKARSPLLEMTRGKNGASLRQTFVMMSGVWLVFLAVAGTLPTVLVGQLHIPGEVMTGTLIIANVVVFLGYLLFGVLGQRFGRRSMLIAGAILNLLITPVLYYVLINGWYQSKLGLIALVTILEVLAVAGTLAIPLAYLTERFSTSVRASGFGVAWSLSLVLPSFYSFYMQGLSALIPYAYTQIALVVVGSIIMIYGAAIGPETRHVELAELGVHDA
jgi:MFS family permease